MSLFSKQVTVPAPAQPIVLHIHVHMPDYGPFLLTSLQEIQRIMSEQYDVLNAKIDAADAARAAEKQQVLDAVNALRQEIEQLKNQSRGLTPEEAQTLGSKLDLLALNIAGIYEPETPANGGDDTGGGDNGGGEPDGGTPDTGGDDTSGGG